MALRKRAFTLVELLVVVAVIGLLVSLLLPAIQSSRDAARRVTCQNHLRQLALAATQYHTTNGHFPSGLAQKQVRWSPRYRGTSLFAYLLPYLEEGDVLDQWNYERPLENTVGGAAALSAKVIPVYLCPSSLLPQRSIEVAGRHFGMTSYGGNGGTRSYDPMRATLDGIFHTTGPGSEPDPNQGPVSVEMVKDGRSNTIFFGERDHYDPNLDTFADVHWAESLRYLGRWAAIGGRKRIGDVTLSGYVPINYQTPFAHDDRQAADSPMGSQTDFEMYEEKRKCAFGSQHGGGANFAMVDGSVRFRDDSIALQLLQSLCTRSGREVVVE